MGPVGSIAGGDLSDRIKDLLSDLHHLCDTAGIDWMLAVGSSAAYYEDEITGNGWEQ